MAGRAAIDEIVRRIIQREGPPKDIGDGMGMTRWGQTPAWLVEFRLPVPSNEVEAASNYRLWLAQTGLIALVGLEADDFADIVIDIAVMSDHRKAVKAVQASIGVLVDGELGPRTLSVLSRMDRKQLARDVIAWDMSFQAAIIQHDPIRMARWAHGWANRLADHVRKLA